MSCSPFDLRDYCLKELPEPERRQVESHVRDCRACREELDRLEMTQAALFSLREEEIPQRVAFVSDAVFEPSPWRRAWSALWNSGPRLGFVSAAMLSAALVVFALSRPPAPQPAPLRPEAPAAAVTAAPSAVSDEQIQARIDAAVAKAIDAGEQRQVEKTRSLVAELETARQRLSLAAEEYELNSKRQIEQRGMVYLTSEPAEGVRQ
jgi:anti-sigma factor RsiW